MVVALGVDSPGGGCYKIRRQHGETELGSARTRQRKGRCTRTRRRLRNGHDGGGRHDFLAYIGIKTGSFPLEKGARPFGRAPFPCSLLGAAERTCPNSAPWLCRDEHGDLATIALDGTRAVLHERT
jgi:hypothetical protein